MDLIFHNGRLLIAWDLGAIFLLLLLLLAIKCVKLGWMFAFPPIVFIVYPQSMEILWVVLNLEKL